MNTFDYITVLVAVVIGLAISDQALSLHRLLRDRARVKWDWVTPLAALMILTEMSGFWWQWRTFEVASLAQLAPFFATLILLFLLAAVSLPDEVPVDGIDLGKYFDDNRSYFWTLYAVYLLIYVPLVILHDVQRGKSTAFLVDRFWFDGVTIIAFLILTRVKPRWISGVALLIVLIDLMWARDWWQRPLSATAY